MNRKVPLVLLAAASTAFAITACGDDDDDDLDVDVNTTGISVDTNDDSVVTTSPVGTTIPITPGTTAAP